VEIYFQIYTAQRGNFALEANRIRMSSNYLVEICLRACVLMVACNIGRGFASGVDGNNVKVAHEFIE
jgi:hypothetical protein